MDNNTTMSTGFMVASFGAIFDFYFPLRWFLIAAIVLIAMDTRFGMAAAKVRGEKIRHSRAFRSSVNKMVDYLCWVTLAAVFIKIFEDSWIGFLGDTIGGVPIAGLILFSLIYFYELDSCYGNYCEARGIEKRWDLFGFFRKKTGLELKEIKKDEKASNNQ